MSDRDLYADGHVLGYTTALRDVKAELECCTNPKATLRLLEKLRDQYMQEAGLT